MIKKLTVLAIAGAIATTGWTAEKDRASKQETMGVGSGAVIGAAAGGPVGFVLGAALGGWLGDRFHDERDQRLTAEAEFAASSAEASRLESLLEGSERETARLESTLRAAQRSHRGALQEALDLQVYFRTGQSSLEDGAERRLARIAELIGPMDGVAVLLEGHADGRGDEQYNEELSAQRADAVREAFIRAGVPADRIAVTAEGERESTAAEKDIDALALERRVHVSIVGSDTAERVARRSTLTE